MGSDFVGFRITQDFKEKLQKEADMRTDGSISHIARIAIQEWIEGRWIKKSDFITLPRSNYVFLLELLNEEQLVQFEEKIALKVNDYFQYLIIEHREQFKNLDVFIEEMIKFIGEQGLNWFEQVDYDANTKKSVQYFKGMHNMGVKWSEIFVGIFSKIVAKHSVNFKIKSESLVNSSSLVYMEFEIIH